MYRKNTDTCKYPYIFGLGQKKKKKCGTTSCTSKVV